MSQRQSALERAKASFDLERGNQEVAKKEYEIAGNSFEGEATDLILRKPQLKTAEAEVTAAQ